MCVCICAFNNRPYSYSQYYTGASLQWRLSRGNIIIKRRLLSFVIKNTPCISLSCELVSFQYRKYEYGLLTEHPE